MLKMRIVSLEMHPQSSESTLFLFPSPTINAAADRRDLPDAQSILHLLNNRASAPWSLCLTTIDPRVVADLFAPIVVKSTTMDNNVSQLASLSCGAQPSQCIAWSDSQKHVPVGFDGQNLVPQKNSYPIISLQT